MNSNLSQAVRDVLAERQRQIAKGWTPEHDDGHNAGEIIGAKWGALGRIERAFWLINKTTVSATPAPIEARELLKEGAAQIIAEMERLDRALAPSHEGEGA
jgi:hypothetical protein